MSKILVFICDMDWSIILGISGIVVTVIISFLIYHLQKVRRYPGRLSASLISLYRVLGERPEHYADLSLNYREYQIENNLLYLRFLVFNERAYDIIADSLETRIFVSLPENLKWVDVRVAKQTEQVDAIIRVEDNNRSKVSIGFDLLRNGDSILFEGLVETEDELFKDSLFEQMRFSHRIPNVDSVEKVECPQERHRRASRLSFRTTVTFILCIVTLFALSFIYKDDVPIMFLDQENNKRVSLALNKNGEIVAYPKILSRRNSYVVPSSEFSSRFVPDIEYHHGYNSTIPLCMAFVFLLFFILMEWEDVKDLQRWKRLSKFL